MIKNLIILPDGTEVLSGTDLAIKSAKLTTCVNGGTELSLGSTCPQMLEATLFDIDAKLSLTAGDEVTLYKVDGTGARAKKGIFILEKPTRPSANTLKFTAYDRITKLDKDLTAWLNGLTGWPYDLLTFAGMVCNACGLTLVTTEIPNSGFLVYRPAKTTATGRQLMKWIGEICCRFCRATADGEIEFAWYKSSGVTVGPSGERYYFQGALSYEMYQVTPIEAVQMRLADSESGALWPEVDAGANSYVITGNAILMAGVTEDLLPYLKVIEEQLAGITYTPCKVAIPACLDVDAGSILNVTDKNGNAITTYVMSKTTSGQKDTLECTGSHRRDSTSAANGQQTPNLDTAKVSVKKVEVYYYLSTSSTALSGGSWAVEAPVWVDGKYIWSKTVTTYSDGTTSESQPVCITGAKGSSGDDGVGVSSITTQFYLSTSKTAQTGGAWVASMPTWSTGKYLWTRSKIVYTNGTTSYTSPVCDSSWEAVDELDQKLNMEEVFNRLTKNGELQGIFMEDGQLYVNAKYIKALEELFAKNITMTGKFECTLKGYLPPTHDDALNMLGHLLFPDKDWYDVPEIDLNGDGIFNEDDCTLAYNVADGIVAMEDCAGAEKSDVTICINMSSADKAICISGTNLWGTYVETHIGANANRSTFVSRERLDRMFSFDPQNMGTRRIFYRYTGSDGYSGALEYLNPPFEDDVEYNTYDTYKGAAVTKKLDSATGQLLWKVSGGSWATYATLMGAAPAGYGLGTIAKNCADCDAALDTGWYQIGIDTLHKPDSTSVWGYGLLHVIRRKDYQVVQVAYSMDGGNHMAIRQMYGWGETTFGAWEYINPPMAVGVEYRTTERWRGKPVYVKLVDLGALPNAADKDVDPGISSVADCVIYVSGAASGGQTIPYNEYIQIRANPGNIRVTTTQNFSSYTGYAVIKYTKK